MAVRPIRKYGDPVLRETSQPIEDITPDIWTLAEDMIDTMLHEQGLEVAVERLP